jgi:mycothiol synthase
MASFDIRHYQTADPDDLPALARLFAETPEVATSGEDISEAMLRAQYEWPAHDPTRDRWVALSPDEPGALAGYACVFKSPPTPRADVLLVVHPAWRSRGLGSELLRRALDHARALGATDASCYAEETDPAAIAFAAAHRFTPAPGYNRLVAPSDTSFPAPTLPNGYTIRACRGEPDQPLFIESANTCYSGLWGHNVVTPDVARDWLVGLDPSGVCFLFGPDGALVGRGMAQRIQRDGQLTGYLDAPGVVPALRGASLYVPLLLWGAAWLAHHPDGPVARYLLESWGDDPATIAAYQSLGFTLDRRETAYRLPLQGA